jgi:hypothetical protein
MTKYTTEAIAVHLSELDTLGAVSTTIAAASPVAVHG